MSRWIGIAVVALVWVAVIAHLFQTVVPRGALYFAISVPALTAGQCQCLGEHLSREAPDM